MTHANYVWYAKGMNKDGANLRHTECGVYGPCGCKFEPFPYKCSCVLEYKTCFYCINHLRCSNTETRSA